MAWAIHECELHHAVSVRSFFLQMIWDGQGEGGKPEIQSDPALLGLGTLVQGGGGQGCGERLNQARFAAVHVPEDTHIHI